MARFSQAWLDELRGRVSLSAVIGRAVKVERAGREFKACCPFHNEATPSFTISDDKGFAHCFGCSWHGDVIRFVMEHDGKGFVEVCEFLAAEAGLAVPAASAEAAAAAARIDGLRPTLEEAARLYGDYLRQAQGHRALAALAARGIDDAAIAEFGLGFAPEHGGLVDKGFSRRDLLGTGLLGKSDGAAGKPPFYYPRFRARIMVPIHDARGQIVGFGGRALDASPVPGECAPTLPGAKPEPTFAEGSGSGPAASARKPAKYVNSADSEIFDKGQLLFNLHRARALFRAARADASGWRGTGRLVLVEGYMDVIALHRAGFAAVAPMGTALTEGQLERAWRVDSCPLLLFDGDAAGQKAAVRAAERALPMLGPGRSLSIGTLPAGMDPDDIVREAANLGEDPAMALGAWLTMHQPATPQSVLADSVFSSVDAATPETWAAAWQQLSTWGSTIENAEVRQLTLMGWRRRWELASGADDTNVKDVDEPDWQVELVRLGFEDGTTLEGGDERVQAMVLWLIGEFDAITERQAGIKDRMAMAKIMGFDPTMLRKIARLCIRDRDKGDRIEKEMIEAAYRRAIGMQGPMTEAMLPPPFAAGGERGTAAQTRKLTKTMLLIGAAEAVEGVR